MSDELTDSLRELTEFALAWSAKHGKCFVGMEVEPAYSEDATQAGFGNPKIIATIDPLALPIVFRRAQFASSAYVSNNQAALFELLRATSMAGDALAWAELQKAAAKVVQRMAEEEAEKAAEQAAGIVRRAVPNTGLSVIDGGRSSAAQSGPAIVPPPGDFSA